MKHSPASQLRAPFALGANDCPYLEHPMPECYCSDLSHRTIPKAVRYCLNRHQLCPVRIQADISAEQNE